MSTHLATARSGGSRIARLFLTDCRDSPGRVGIFSIYRVSEFLRYAPSPANRTTGDSTGHVQPPTCHKMTSAYRTFEDLKILRRCRTLLFVNLERSHLHHCCSSGSTGPLALCGEYTFHKNRQRRGGSSVQHRSPPSVFIHFEENGPTPCMVGGTHVTWRFDSYIPAFGTDMTEIARDQARCTSMFISCVMPLARRREHTGAETTAYHLSIFGECESVQFIVDGVEHARSGCQCVQR